MTMIPITSKEMMDPKFQGVSAHYPAFTVTTGVYDFYMKNPFTIANHHAVLAGQMLALHLGYTDLYNNNVVNLLGYSLGTIFVYNTLVTLYDIGCNDRVGDVCLMGGCVDEKSLGHNIHKLVGSRGVVQGTLTVHYTRYDSVLKYMFRSVRLGEAPVGLTKLNFDFLARCLQTLDPAFSNLSQNECEAYLRRRIDNPDVSKWCTSHFDFKKRANLIMPHCDFNGDLKHFKESSQ